MSGETIVPARVRLALTSRPEAPRLARSVSAAAGEALAFDGELLSDVNTAVTEACNNVVLHAYDGAPGPFSVELNVDEDGIEVEVRDHGRGIQQTAPEYDGLQVGFALMSALADRAEFGAAAGGGTEVRLTFRRTMPAWPQQPRKEGLEGEEGGHPSNARDVHMRSALSGNVVLTVSPVQLLDPVLGRLGRSLAPAAGFSPDRCADVCLVADALAAHATRAAEETSITVALGASERRLEFALAPLRAGMSTRLGLDGPPSPSAPLAYLTDELTVDHTGGHDTLLVAMREHRRAGA
jgi:serine/threonine-protein kinase RsbW